MAPGAEVTLGVRPEDVQPGGEHTLNVDFIEELGAQRLCHGEFAGQAFMALTSAVTGAPQALTKL